MRSARLATLLAALGLYGVLAYTVSMRTREFGELMALGAAPGRVRGMVMRQVGVMTLVGAAIGLTGAIALGKLSESLLYQLKRSDPLVLSGAALALAVVALGAGFIRRTAHDKVDRCVLYGMSSARDSRRRGDYLEECRRLSQ